MTTSGVFNFKPFTYVYMYYVMLQYKFSTWVIQCGLNYNSISVDISV